MKFLLLFVFLLSIFGNQASAQTMSNSNYKLKMGNFNFSSGDLSGSENRLRFTAGEISLGFSSGTNYELRAGFQYIEEPIPFAFSVSPTTIDFGTVTPNNPVVRASDLTVSNGSANGYTVTISADRQPTSQEGHIIPGTSCDSGNCSDINAAPWTSTLAYGFGFRCDNVSGLDCNGAFLENYYKSLPISPSIQNVMSGGIGRNKEAQVSYKVNISPTQQAGIYRNTLTFIAAPNF